MRKRGRVDGNQTQVVKELRALGVSVSILSNVGGGVPDIVAGYRGNNFLFEIKDPAQPPSKRKLTPDESEFFDSWRGSCHVITSAAAAWHIIEVKTFNSRG